MTDFSITISNEINVLGGASTSVWGAYNWNAFVWGEGGLPIIWSLDHLISNSLTIDSGTSSKDLETHVGSSLSLDTQIIKEVDKFITESISPVTEISNLTLMDQNGYAYVFVPGTTNAQDRTGSSYSSGVVSAVSWVSLSSGSLIWS